MTREAMKTTVVCGMLGAGKTTFIGHFIKCVKGKAVVLVNDFGTAGIDGEIFSADGIESIELPSGCICCTLKFDLITTIKKIIDTLSPDHLLIEPSGIASPSGILDAIETLKLTAYTVIGIVDATEFLELNHEDAFGRFFADQITNSDVILVNKTDLVDAETARRTAETIGRMNENAIVLRTVNCITSSPVPAMPLSPKAIDRDMPHVHYDTISMLLEDGLDFEAISGLFHDMATGKYGDIIRAKALVNTLQGPYKFDLSFANVHCVPFAKEVAGSRLVVIGRDVKREVLYLTTTACRM